MTGFLENRNNSLSPQQRIEALLADDGVAKTLPKVIGSLALVEEFNPETGPTEAEVAVREGYDRDPPITFIYLADLMRSAIENDAAVDYLRRLLGKTSLPLQHARLRYETEPDAVKLFDHTYIDNLKS